MDIEIMEQHILSFDDIFTFSTGESPTIQARIVVNSMKHYMFITKFSDDLYVLNEHRYFTKIPQPKVNSKLIVITRSFIETSFNKLDEIQKQLLRGEKQNRVKTLLSDEFIKKVIGEITEQLKKCAPKENLINNHIGQIHFLNGYIDVQTGKLTKRTSDQYITEVINRDYKEPTKESVTTITKIISQIYPREDDRTTTLQVFGAGLTGKSTEQQDMIFWISKGSGGKSTTWNLTQSALTKLYAHTLPSDTFCCSETQKNKVINHYVENRNILFSFLNDMKTEKMDAELFKNFIEGKVTCTMLYENGSQDMMHHSKIIGAGNSLPNIMVDTGTARRIKGNELISRFTENENEVDESKHIYLKDETLLRQINESDDLKNAWISIIVNEAVKLNNGSKIVYSKGYQDFKATTINANDYITDFVESTLIRCDDENSGRVGKREMYTLFREEYPEKHLNELQLISALKDRNITYNKDLRCKKTGTRGCFIGVRVKKLSDEMRKKPEKIDDNKCELLEIENENMKKIIEDLKADNKRLQERQTTYNQYTINTENTAINNDTDATIYYYIVPNSDVDVFDDDDDIFDLPDDTPMPKDRLFSIKKKKTKKAKAKPVEEPEEVKQEEEPEPEDEYEKEDREKRELEAVLLKKVKKNKRLRKLTIGL